MNKKYRLFILPVLLAQIAFAQKQTTHLQQIWTGYFNQTRYTEKLGMWLDLHLRTKDIDAIRVFYFHNLDLRKKSH